MEDGRLAAIAEVEGLPRPWNPVWVGWQNAKNYFKTFLRQADAEFIAHARRDVPMLIAEVERLRAGAVPQQEPQDRLWRALLYWERTKMALDAVRPDFTPDQLRELNAAEGRLLSVIEELRPAVPALPAPQEQDGKS